MLHPGRQASVPADDVASFLDNVGNAVLDGEMIHIDDAMRIAEIDDSHADLVFTWSNRIRDAFRGNQIHLCSIINAKSGGCTEDCSFCAQAARYQTESRVYPFLDKDEVLPVAEDAKRNKAQALGLVAAWRGLQPGRMLDEVCRRIEDVAQSGTVRADASLGIIESRDVAQRLKTAGLVAYNHNLESARSFYPKVCSTHTYEDRVQTIRHCKDAGLKVCSGGIIGMGETWRQRVELACELRELDVDIVPINFLHPIPGTPMAGNHPLTPLECLRTIALFRFVMPNKEIMVAGGREVNLGDEQVRMFEAGASAILIGNYLTTIGRKPEDDLKMIEDLGLTWEWSEH